MTPEALKFFGWRLVAAACAIQFLQAAFFHNAFGLYFAVLNEEFGWSKTALSGASALQPMESAILGPLLGWMIDRYGPKRMIRVGVAIFGLGFIVLGSISTLTGFYIAIVIIAFGSSLCGYFPLNVAVIRWFEQYRARAISALSFGLALGGTAIPLVAASMQTWGWRATAIGSGVIVLVLGLPLLVWFKDSPAEIGEVVDGKTAHAQKLAQGFESNQVEFTAAQALRTKAFWLISLGHGFALLVVYAVNVHAVTHVKESMGYSLAQASMVMSAVTVAQIIGVLAGGWLGDRYEKRWLAAACMLGHCLGLLLLAFSVNVWMLGLFALLHGIAWGMRGPMMQAIRADYFGSRAIGMILGISSLVIVVGQIGGPMIAALMADWTGDYRWGFGLLAILVGLGSLFFVYAHKPIKNSAEQI